MSEENKNIPPKQSTENMTEVEHGETPTSNEEIKLFIFDLQVLNVT